VEICGLEKSQWTSPLVSLVVMSESFENNSIFLDLEGKNKTSNVDSFIIAAISPEILEMLDGCFIAVNDLIDLLSDCDGECLVPTSELVKQAFEFGRDNEIKCHVILIPLTHPVPLRSWTCQKAHPLPSLTP